jgi:hypothetical protein
MRRILLLPITFFLLFTSCDKDSVFLTEEAFFEKTEGVWLLHQKIYEQGLVMYITLGPPPLCSLYGNAVKINKDGSFIPMTVTPNSISYDSSAVGTCRYNHFLKELIATGQGQGKFLVKKISDTELWLKAGEQTYQFQKY